MGPRTMSHLGPLSPKNGSFGSYIWERLGPAMGLLGPKIVFRGSVLIGIFRISQKSGSFFALLGLCLGPVGSGPESFFSFLGPGP